jgi:TP901-1 family phage major tail protein
MVVPVFSDFSPTDSPAPSGGAFFLPIFRRRRKDFPMPVQKGRDLLLKLDIADTFTTVAGLRASRIALNAQTVDITTRESVGRWRELLAGAGLRSAADAAIRALFFDTEIARWQVILPDFGVLEGPFQITALEFSGDHDGAMTYDLTLASAGELAFTAHA